MIGDYIFIFMDVLVCLYIYNMYRNEKDVNLYIYI